MSDESKSSPEQNAGIPIIKVDTSSSKPGKGKRSKPRKASRRDSGTFDASALPGAASASPASSSGTKDPVIKLDNAPTVGSADDAPSSTDAEVPVIDVKAQPAISSKPATGKRTLGSKSRSKQPQTIAPAIEIADPTKNAKADEDTTASVAQAVKIDTVETKGKGAVRRAVAPASSSKTPARGKKPGGRQTKKKPIPQSWIVGGACGATALIVIVLVVAMMGGPADKPASSGRQSRSRPSSAQPYTGPSSLPTFKSDIPSGGGGTGVRAMTAEEKARRREGMDSFAAMAQEEEEKLREEKKKQ